MKTKLILIGLFVMVSLGTIINLNASESESFSENDKACLLNISRYTLQKYLTDGDYPFVDKTKLPASLHQKRACFVTLSKKGTGLRGCIGLFEPDQPIYFNVMDRTIYAATRDPRFRPVSIDELKEIKIEISILTIPEPLHAKSPDELLQNLRPGTDGVILETRFGSSTYLPQVWEQLPDKVSFLSHLCEKHGAPPDIWKNDFKNIRISIYQAIHFEEDEYGRKVVGGKGAVVGKNGARLLGCIPCDCGLKTVNVNPGDHLKPGTIVSSDSDIVY
ncbi:MAG: AmmeMemoRadiSam system protein A [Proteobacteria bacterium]|nr:AmmeMemoRadiSam system protein A [Pseudomonadota bacterium]